MNKDKELKKHKEEYIHIRKSIPKYIFRGIGIFCFMTWICLTTLIWLFKVIENQRTVYFNNVFLDVGVLFGCVIIILGLFILPFLVTQDYMKILKENE